MLGWLGRSGDGQKHEAGMRLGACSAVEQELRFSSHRPLHLAIIHEQTAVIKQLVEVISGIPNQQIINMANHLQQVRKLWAAPMTDSPCSCLTISAGAFLCSWAWLLSPACPCSALWMCMCLNPDTRTSK